MATTRTCTTCKMASSNTPRRRRPGGTCLACSSFPYRHRLNLKHRLKHRLKHKLKLKLKLTPRLTLRLTHNPTRNHSCSRTQPSLGMPRTRTACLSSPRLVSEPSSRVFAPACAMLTDCKL